MFIVYCWIFSVIMNTLVGTSCSPAIFLTVGDFLVRVQVFVHIHGEIHHVRFAEEVQLSLKKFLLIVDLLKISVK